MQTNVGDMLQLTGCFTEEYCLRGLIVNQIAKELGLLENRFKNGIFIAWAIQLPTMSQFELAGWVQFPTDKFATYHPQKGTQWHRILFEQTYKDKRMPISIEQAKQAWLQNMKHEKLVKVLMNIPGQGEDFPAGGKASQIIVTSPIMCSVVKKLSSNDVFNGVW